MVHTAIIAFGLIFLMFYLKECGNKEITENVDTTKEVKTKESIESKEINISKNEKVITLIKSETTLEKTQVPITEVELILDENEKNKVVMDVVSQIELENKSITDEEKKKLKAELINEIRPELSMELLTLEKAKAKKIVSEKSKEEKSNTEIKHDNLPKEESEVKVATAVKVDTEVKSEDNTKQQIAVQGLVSQDNTTNSKENKNLSRENDRLKNKIAQLLTIAQRATIKAKSEHDAETQKMQNLVTEQKSLKAELKSELRNEQSLMRNNSELQNKITKLLYIAETATVKVKAEHDAESKKMQDLIDEQNRLKANFKNETRNDRDLTKENSELKEKISKLLAIAEKATIKAQAEDEAEAKEIKTLLLQQKELSSKIDNQESLIGENSKLKETINKLLAIAEKATEKALAEDSEKSKEMQTLLSQQKELTSKLSNQKLLKGENSKLKDTITRLLAIAEKATTQAQAEDTVKTKEMQSLSLLAKDATSTAKDIITEVKSSKELEAKEIQSLLSHQKDLESNITAELEKEKALTVEVSTLKGKIAELLSIAEKATSKAEAQHNGEKQEFQTLLSQKGDLEGNLTAELEKEKALEGEVSTLKGKIAELLSIAEKATSKAEAQHDGEKQEFQTLLSQKGDLEGNLTAELEKEKALKEENLKLQEALEKEKSLEDNLTKTLADTEAKLTTLATEQDEKSNKEIQSLLSQKGDLEGNLTAELEKEKALKGEISTLKGKIVTLLSIAEKATSEAKTQHDGEKQELQTLLSQKGDLEGNLSSELEREKALKEENLKLQETLEKEKALEANLTKSLEDTKSKLATLAEEKAKSEALAKKAEEERLAKEKAKAEALAQKAEEERLTQEKAILDTFALTKVEFKYNSMDLTSKSKKLLNNVAKVMKEHSDYHYNIQGHTDNRGNDEYNLKLSARRAKKVKDYLVLKGVDSSILTTEGLGSLQPIATNDTKKGRLLNRRVVFEIVK